MQIHLVIHPLICMCTHTCPDCRESCEELTEQQLLAQDLLDVFLAFHRESLHEASNQK